MSPEEQLRALRRMLREISRYTHWTRSEVLSLGWVEVREIIDEIRQRRTAP